MTFTSPYARKVRVVARELALSVEEVAVDPHANDETLLERSPVGKVPVLVLSDGVVHDSRVITAYLDGLSTDGPSLRPAGRKGLQDQVLEAEADAILDTAVSIVLEERRDPSEQSPRFLERQRDRIVRILREAAVPDPSPSLGRLAFAVALGYLDFRRPEILWRENRDDLASWFSGFAGRSSMIETLPPPGS